MQDSTRRRDGFRAGLLVSVLIVCLTGIVSVPADANANANANAEAEAEAADDEADWVAQSLDATLLRPLGAVRLVAGSLLYLPVSFFNGLSQSSVAALNAVGLASEPNWGIFAETLDIFVLDPSRFLFTRPIGEDIYRGN